VALGRGCGRASNSVGDNLIAIPKVRRKATDIDGRHRRHGFGASGEMTLRTEQQSR